jgi:hypothetical protein
MSGVASSSSDAGPDRSDPRRRCGAPAGRFPATSRTPAGRRPWLCSRPSRSSASPKSTRRIRSTSRGTPWGAPVLGTRPQIDHSSEPWGSTAQPPCRAVPPLCTRWPNLIRSRPVGGPRATQFPTLDYRILVLGRPADSPPGRRVRAARRVPPAAPPWAESDRRRLAARATPGRAAGMGAAPLGFPWPSSVGKRPPGRVG